VYYKRVPQAEVYNSIGITEIKEYPHYDEKVDQKDLSFNHRLPLKSQGVVNNTHYTPKESGTVFERQESACNNIYKERKPDFSEQKVCTSSQSQAQGYTNLNLTPDKQTQIGNQPSG
jgi:hypothetical protein